MTYVDPGTLGLITQLGYAVLFLAVSAVLFVPRRIGRLLKRRKHPLAPSAIDGLSSPGPTADDSKANLP